VRTGIYHQLEVFPAFYIRQGLHYLFLIKAFSVVTAEGTRTVSPVIYFNLHEKRISKKAALCNAWRKAQFYAIYWYAFAAGGFYFDDSTYEEGDGTVWELTSSDDAEGLLLEKALLKEESDGSRWWRVAFTSDGDRYVYEYHIGSDYRFLEMSYKDVSGNQVGSYTFKGDEGVQYGVVPTSSAAESRTSSRRRPRQCGQTPRSGFPERK
jgi:hypothetical protein